jgi:outer membrane protein W
MWINVNSLTKIVIMSLCLAELSAGQGISRPHGAGFRASYWNGSGKSTEINLRNTSGTADVRVNGFGGWLYFFSRAYDNWFMELNVGGVAMVDVKNANTADGADPIETGESVEVETIIPILLGVRYDLFASRLPGAFHPYLSAGFGPHLLTHVRSQTSVEEQEQNIKTTVGYGGYLGGGMHIMLSSWSALNFDFKYHNDFESVKRYQGMEFGFGCSFMWGRQREVFEVEDIRLIVTDIYPAYYNFYRSYPVALVTIRNLISYPIDVTISSRINDYSEKAMESDTYQIKRGERIDIPITVHLGKNLRTVVKSNTAILDLQIQGRASTVFKKEISTPIVIHSRNAWNGKMDMLSCFLTPEDDAILTFSRNMVSGSDYSPMMMNNFIRARLLFNRLTELGIRYHPDPNIPFYRDDRVQYAAETLDLGMGDCDDLAVLYRSLLESAGISAAFVEVCDPEKQQAHLYIMFDSALSPAQGALISDNEKRYIIRENGRGPETLWIPVETTLVEKGFEEAWKTAALAYLQEGVLRNGLTEGWLKVID